MKGRGDATGDQSNVWSGGGMQKVTKPQTDDATCDQGNVWRGGSGMQHVAEEMGGADDVTDYQCTV